MNATQLKALLASVFKPVSGGPTNITRAAPVRDALGQIVDWVVALANRGPNERPSAYKTVTVISATSQGYAAGMATRDGLAPETLCLGAVCRTEFSDATDGTRSQGVTERLAYTPGSALVVFKDGRFTGPRTFPAAWYSADSLAAVRANIRPITSTQATPPFTLDEVGTYTRAGVEGFYRYKAPTGGTYAVPTSADDANWHQVAPPVPAAALVVTLPISTFRVLYDDQALGAYAGKLLILTGRAGGLQVRVQCTGLGEVSGADAYTYNGNTGAYTPVTYDPTADTWTLRGTDYEDRIHTLESDLVDLENEVANLTTDEVAEGTTNKYFTAARAIVSALTGYVKATTARAITATDSIRTAIGLLEKKADDNATALTAASGTDLYKGTWNPAANTPLLSALGGTKGWYYKLSADSPAPKTTTITQYFPNDTELRVASTAGIAVGMLVSGTGIPAGVRVTAVGSGIDVSVFPAVDAPNGTALSFTFNFAGQSSIAAGAFVWYSGTAWEVRTFSEGSGATGPWPPLTNPVTDDTNKYFRATMPANYRTESAEATTDSGASWATCTETMRSGEVISVPVVGGKAAGVVQLRIRAGSGRAASAVASNATAFTAASIDKTRYAFFGTAGGAGNSGSQWTDESGHSNHLTNSDTNDTFVRTTDSNGKAVMRSSDDTGGVFHLPFSSGNSDYTIYALLRPNSLQNPYLLDCPSHTLGLGFNNSDFGAYFGGDGSHGTGAVSVASGELVLITWRLSGSVGRVYKNGTLVYTGTYSPRQLTSGATLGHDNSAYYAPFNGDLHAFALRLGSDTDAQVSETQSYLAGLAGLAL